METSSRILPDVEAMEIIFVYALFHRIGGLMVESLDGGCTSIASKLCMTFSKKQGNYLKTAFSEKKLL